MDTFKWSTVYKKCWGMYYKHFGFCRKLVCLTKPVKVTDNDKKH